MPDVVSVCMRREKLAGAEAKLKEGAREHGRARKELEDVSSRIKVRPGSPLVSPAAADNVGPS